MKHRSLLLALVVFMAMTSAAMADCNQPDDPEIPDGPAASGADMLKAKKAIEAHVSAAEEYMGCGVASALKDRMAGRMEKVVDKFNKELRAYKSKE